MESDDLSFDQVSVFTHVPDHLADELAAGEVMLVNAAFPLTVADTRRLVEYWKTAVDGPGGETTVEELEERRYLHASRMFEGMVKVDGLFDRRRPEERPAAASRRFRPPGPFVSRLRSSVGD